MSSLKTNSSKGGGGFNEQRIEDKKDSEEIFVHAQKNLQMRVVNDRFENIGNDRHLVVEHDKIEHVKNKRNETVDADHVEKISKDRHLSVGGKEAKEVTESLSLKVSGDVIEEFKSKHSEVVTADYFLKADNIVIEGLTNVTIKVGGNSITIEKSGISIVSGESAGILEAIAQKPVSVESKTDAVNIKSMMDTTIAATNKFSAKGTAGVAIESPANTELKGSAVTVSGSGMLTLKGGVVAIN
jgi:type VI secretion system secreted protein VgrG